MTAPLRMSNVDAAWLGMDSPDNLMMVTAVLRLAEPIDRDRLEEVFAQPAARALPEVLDAAAAVGQPVRAAGVDRRPGRSTSARHLVDAGAVADDEELAGLVSGLLGTPLDMRHSPWQFHLVALPAPDGSGPASALVARLHHCIADGIALASVLLSLTDDDPDTDAGGGRGRTTATRAGPASAPG